MGTYDSTKTGAEIDAAVELTIVNQAAIAALDVRVSTAEDNITSLTQSVTDLTGATTAAVAAASASATAASTSETNAAASEEAASASATAAAASATAASDSATLAGTYATAAAESAAGLNVALRSDFVTRNTAGEFSAMADGVTLTVEGLRYMRQSAATCFPDLAGWVPVAPAWPEHWNIVVDGQGTVTYNGVEVVYNSETLTYDGGTDATTLIGYMLDYCTENSVRIEWGPGTYMFDSAYMMGDNPSVDWVSRGGNTRIKSIKATVNSSGYDADYFIYAGATTLASGNITSSLNAGGTQIQLDATTVAKIIPGDSLLHIQSDRVIETDDRGQARVGWTVGVSRIVSSTVVETEKPIPMFVSATSTTGVAITSVNSAARQFTCASLAGQSVSSMRYKITFVTVGGASSTATAYPSEFDPTTGTFTLYSSSYYPTGLQVGDTININRNITYFATNSVKVNIEGIEFTRDPHLNATAGDYGFRGLFLSRCNAPRIDNSVFRNFSETGLRVDSSYLGCISNVETVNANRAYNGSDGTGYGISVYQSSWGTYENISGSGCRRTLDFSGTQMISWNNTTDNISNVGGGMTYDGTTRFWPIGTVEQSVVGSHGAAYGTVYNDSKGIDVHGVLNMRGKDELVRGIYGAGTVYSLLNTFDGDGCMASGFYYSDQRPDWIANPSRYAKGSLNGKLTTAIVIRGDIQPNRQFAFSDFHIRGLDMSLVSLQDAPTIGSLTLGGVIDIAVDNESGGTYTTFNLVRVSGIGSPTINGMVDLGSPTIRNKPSSPKTKITLIPMTTITWGLGSYVKAPDGSVRFYLADNAVMKLPCNSVSPSGVIELSRAMSTSPEYAMGVMLATAGRLNTGMGFTAAVDFLTSQPTGTTGTDGNISVWFDASSGVIYVENRSGAQRLWRLKFSELAV